MGAMRVFQITLFSILHLSLTQTVLPAGPVGVNLCDQLCFYTIGCKKYVHLPDQLLCFKGNETDATDNKNVTKSFKINSPQQFILAEGPYCKPGSRVIVARSKRRVCLQDNTASTSSGYHELLKGGTTYLYKRYTDLRFWNQSMEQCIEDGGILAQLQGDFKWDMLPKIFNLSSTYKLADCMWIGLSDANRNDKFVWADGTEIKDRNRWYRGYLGDEPSHTMLVTEENCAGVRYLYKRLTLFDINMKYICEVIIKN